MTGDSARTILIVEDHEQMRELVALTLRPLGAKLFEASNAADALAIAFAHHPTVIILDVQLYGPIDGYDVCRTLRASPQLQRSRIVIVTTRTHPDEVAIMEAVGADAYLIKPFSPGQLFATVRDLLT